jgi:pyruvate/2-oxoglutarate dehydrogenase complex dihydrolipoamide acyltransferase (E2) component
MKVTLKLNRVGMTMEEATLLAWSVKPGEEFSKDDVLYEIETEKVAQEVIAPVSGKLLEILVEEEAELAVGDDVCVIETDETVEEPKDQGDN